jgi:hypothetical protein
MPPKKKVKLEKGFTLEDNMPSKTTPPTLKRLLVINPNTSQSMTDGLENLIEDLGMYSTFIHLMLQKVYNIIVLV